jgi:hypothetical protein
MSIRKFSICFVLSLLTFMLFYSVCFAERGEINDVKRNVPEQMTEGEIAEIKLHITGAKPFMAGIVETIPQGFTFPENDVDVSDFEFFKLDRDTGKIAFAVKDETELIYKVIPSSVDGSSFEGYWVDMLLQSPELNQGENMWLSVTDPDAVSVDRVSDAATETETGGSSPTIGTVYFILIGLIIVIAGVFIWKKSFSGGNKK